MVDGAARGNPGEELSRYLGRVTRNVAENKGLLMCLESLLRSAQKNIVEQSDSRPMVRQLNGAYRVKDEKAQDSVRPS